MVQCFCFGCGRSWEGYSSVEIDCACTLARVIYTRPCVEDMESIDAIFISENSELLTLEQTVQIPLDEFPSTIFGISLPKNIGIIKRNIIDFQNNEVKLFDGSIIDIDSYYYIRDIGI